MAIQTLLSGRDPGQIGTALGTGLSGLLEGLAQAKLQQFQKAQQVQSLQNMSPLITPQIAEALVNTDPSLRPLFIKDILAAPGERAAAEAFAQYRGGVNQESPSTAYEPQGIETQTPMPSLSPIESLQLLQGSLPQEKLMQAIGYPSSAYQARSMRGAGAEQARSISSQQQPQTQERRIPLKYQADLAKMQQKERQFEQKRQDVKEEKTGKILDEIYVQKVKSDEKLFNIDEQIRLNEKGDLPNPLFYSMMERFNINIPALLGGDAEYYRSLQKDMFQDLKSIFGARPTDFDVKQFVAALPTLANSQEGRRIILQKMKYIEQARRAGIDAKEEIIKKNKNIAPHNLSSQAYELEKKKKDKLFKKFTEGLDKYQQQTRKTEKIFNSLPSASQYKGRELRTENGKILISDGIRWKEKKNG